MSKADAEQEAELRQKAVGRYADLAGEAMAAVADILGGGLDPARLGRAVGSKIGGISAGQVYNWSEGHSPVHFAALGSLSVYSPDTLVRLCDAALRFVGRRSAPIGELPESRPSVPDALREVSEAGAAASESYAAAIRRLLDGPMTPAKLGALEQLWKREDDETAEARAVLRAMAATPTAARPLAPPDWHATYSAGRNGALKVSP